MPDVMESKPRKNIKGSQTKQRILESAIHCLAEHGPSGATFQAIADHCKISQTLVVHYFRKKENVFPDVIDYLVERTKKIIDVEVDRADSATLQLQNFIRLSILAVRKDTAAAKVFLTLNFLAAFDKSYQQRSGRIKQMVVDQIAEILQVGIRKNEFKVQNINQTARQLTAYLTGVRLMLLNEKVNLSDETVIAVTAHQWLLILGVNLSTV